MPVDVPPYFSSPQPQQEYGSYCAWSIDGGPEAIFDQLWYNRPQAHAPQKHRLLPFHEPSLAIRRQLSADGSVHNILLLITSASTEGGCFRPNPNEDWIALRLKPERMIDALGLSPRDFRDCPAQPPPPLLYHAVEPALDHAVRGDLLGAWRKMAIGLLRYNKGRSQTAAGMLASALRSSLGNARPGDATAQIGLSARHLRRCFGDEFGISPRGFAKRARLTHALLYAEASAVPNWADIAVAFGFCDQSHLIRDCGGLLGLSPTRLLAQRSAMAESFNTVGAKGG